MRLMVMMALYPSYASFAAGVTVTKLGFTTSPNDRAQREWNGILATLKLGSG
jgi:hypothetical protein